MSHDFIEVRNIANDLMTDAQRSSFHKESSVDFYLHLKIRRVSGLRRQQNRGLVLLIAEYQLKF